MQQRQLRLGDILDDYCPRERRVTNHAVVAMLENEVKQTRCTTCDTEHEYKHAKVPRQRRKSETPAALYSQVLANAPKRVTHDGGTNGSGEAQAPLTDEPATDVELALDDTSERQDEAIAAPAPEAESIDVLTADDVDGRDDEEPR